MKKIGIILGLFFAIANTYSQNANISYEVRVNRLRGTCGSSISGSSCWEATDLEYTGNVRIDNPTTGTNFCMTANISCSGDYGQNTFLRSSTDVATTSFNVVYDMFEDDGGNRCVFDGGDDCRAAGSYNIPIVNNFSPTAVNSYNNFQDNQVYNSGSSQHFIGLNFSWRYAGTANAISPTCALQSVAYGSGAIRSWSVFLTAGRTYNFNDCAGTVSDTYLRLYASDGFTVLSTADDNCGNSRPTLTYTAAISGWHYIELSQFSRGPLTTSGTFNYEDVTPAPGNPAVFGSNAWNVYGYTGGGISLNGEYSGFYTESSLSFNSLNRWGTLGSPSDASGWQGCYVPVDNHVVVSKRQGFPCGNYQLDMPNHDDDIQVYVNGSLVFQHIGCCDAHTNLWTGVLNSSSTVEVRHLEGGGGSHQSLDFLLLSNLIPATPGAIAGTSPVCPGATTTYSISAVADANSYTWSVPAGWAINSGQGSTSINVTAGTSGGNISVFAVGTCGNSAPSTRALTLLPAAPAQPGAITGSNSVCANVSQTYSIAAVPNATTYTWSVPSGWVINSGQGGTSISVTTSSNNGQISVTAANSCGTSVARSVLVSILTNSSAAASITNSVPTICLGGSSTLKR
jgi:hypothetical protein